MSEKDNTTRRTVLKSCGSLGALVTGFSVSGPVSATDDNPADSFITFRETSGTIPFEKIDNARRRMLAEQGNANQNSSSVQSTILAKPETHRDRIVAYNFGIIDGQPTEYFGYYVPSHENDHSPVRETNRGDVVNQIHNNADKHVKQKKNSITRSSSEFSNWSTHYDVTEDEKGEDGNIYLKSDVYRYQSNESPDAYGIVSWGEMGAGGLDSVNDLVRNNGLTLEHNWASNAEMEHDSRFPTSLVTGTTSTNWSVSLSLPKGITATGGTSYSQPDVQTYDESDPWNDYGKWVVEIDSSHTSAYTAHVNPGSLAEVDREDCVNPPYSPPVQPVGTVDFEAVFYDLSGASWTKELSTTLNDSASMC